LYLEKHNKPLKVAVKKSNYYGPHLMDSLYPESEVVLCVVNIPNERGNRALTKVREVIFLRDSAPYGVKSNTGLRESDCFKFSKGLSLESYINMQLVQRSCI
jgi:hypothetical protein